MTRAGLVSYKPNTSSRKEHNMTQEELNQVAGVVTTLMKEKISELTSQFDAKIAELKPQQAVSDLTPQGMQQTTQTGAQPAAQPGTQQGTLPGIGALLGNPFDSPTKESTDMDALTAQLSEQLKISQELNRKLIGSLTAPGQAAQAKPEKTAEEVLANSLR